MVVLSVSLGCTGIWSSNTGISNSCLNRNFQCLSNKTNYLIFCALAVISLLVVRYDNMHKICWGSRGVMIIFLVSSTNILEDAFFNKDIQSTPIVSYSQVLGDFARSRCSFWITSFGPTMHILGIMAPTGRIVNKTTTKCATAAADLRSMWFAIRKT